MMKHNKKTIISLVLVSILTACGSTPSLTINEGNAIATSIRLFQQSENFEAPNAFHIKRTTEEVIPLRADTIRRTERDIIVDVNHHYFYDKNKTHNKKDTGEETIVTTETWTYIDVEEETIYFVNIGESGVKTYNTSAINVENDITFINLRNSFSASYFGNNPIGRLIDTFSITEYTGPTTTITTSIFGFLTDNFYSTGTVTKNQTDIRSSKEGSLDVKLNLEQKFSSEINYKFIFEASFSDYLLDYYDYFDIAQNQYTKTHVSVSRSVSHHYPDLEEFENTTNL